MEDELKQVTQSDRLVAADRLGLPTYNPRLLPAIRTYVEWGKFGHCTMYRMGINQMVEGELLPAVAVTLDTFDGFICPEGWWLNDERNRP